MASLKGRFSVSQGQILSQFTASQGVPLQVSFEGVAINVTVGGVTTQAIPYFVSPGQITAILPSKTPVGDGTLTVSSGGQTSSALIHVVQSAFGLMTLQYANLAVVQNSSQGGETLSQTNAANPGEYLVLWGSGLGSITGDETQNQPPSNLSNIPIEVDIGGVSAVVTYRGRSVYPGLDQIDVIVPPGISGCYVSVVVVAGGVPSNFATIPVVSSGRLCSDSDLIPVPSEEYQGLLSLDNVNVAAISLNTVTSSNPDEHHHEQFGLRAASKIHGPAVRVRWLPAPAVYRQLYGFLWRGAAPVFSLDLPGPTECRLRDQCKWTRWLAGTGPAVSRLCRTSWHVAPIIPPTGGAFTFNNGSGGPEVGPFTASLSLNLTNPLVWTNSSAITVIDRAKGHLITWTGGISGSYISIFGYSFAQEYSPLANGSDVYTYFTCSAPVSAGQFTVPAAVLGSLLPTGTVLGNGLPPAGNGYLYVVNGITQQFSAPGLDLGLLFLSTGTGISAPFN